MPEPATAQTPDATRAHIQARLSALEAEHGVRVLFAAESGSRAWGFASPDSDYDVRFVYAHSTDWYVSLAAPRDVIEAPLDPMLVDLAGWDVRKALRLLLKSNAALYEWTRSPILYRDGPARAAISTLFEAVASRHSLALHYTHTAQTNWKRCGDGREVKLKRYFYFMRPLLAREWALVHGTPPPMHMDHLLAAVPLPPTVQREFRDLIAAKTTTPELGCHPRRRALDAWIMDRLADQPVAIAEVPPPDAAARADDLFRALIGFAPAAR
ncbi:MAG: nucleotidyltransferase domain-containing protein [Hyphomicrobiaceae bacterium]|nr:nucleotidyltransferase domain-containing protein [Hyphomicrobiaceae bacterium]